MDEDDGNANKDDRDGYDAGQTHDNTASILYDDVDDFLTKELLLLTTRDRNETPKLLQHALSQLADKIEHKIAKKKKRVYLLAQHQQSVFVH